MPEVKQRGSSVRGPAGSSAAARRAAGRPSFRPSLRRGPLGLREPPAFPADPSRSSRPVLPAAPCGGGGSGGGGGRGRRGKGGASERRKGEPGGRAPSEGLTGLTAAAASSPSPGGGRRAGSSSPSRRRSAHGAHTGCRPAFPAAPPRSCLWPRGGGCLSPRSAAPPEPQGRAPRSRSRARPTRARSHPPGSGRRVLPPPRRFPPAPPRCGAALLRLAAPLSPPPTRPRAPLRAALFERHPRPRGVPLPESWVWVTLWLLLASGCGKLPALTACCLVLPKCSQSVGSELQKAGIKRGPRWFRGTSAAQKACGCFTAPEQLFEAFLKPYKST